MCEAFPSFMHQRTIGRIRASLPMPIDQPQPPTRAYLHVSDACFLFPDGSFKRPDVAILCREPPIEDQRTAIRVIPAAVIEIVNPGYEDKDLEIGPRFYLSQVVKDAVVFDPETTQVLHYRRGGIRRDITPMKIQPECGCSCTV